MIRDLWNDGWGGRLNARAEVRRYLRADNVSLRGQAKPTLLAQRIVAPPRHVETIPDQVAAMRSEVADLTELCLELADVVARTAAVLVPRREAEQKRGRRLDALAHVPIDGTATTTDAVAAALGVDQEEERGVVREPPLLRKGFVSGLPDWPKK